MTALTKPTRDYLRQQLELSRKALAADVGARLADARHQHIAPDVSAVTDGGDHASLEAAEQWDLTAAAHGGEELEAVEAALRRLDAGSFGTCIDCHQKIAPARLLVHPAAVRCTACERAREERAGFSAAHR